MQALEEKLYSPEEYLQLEETAAFKSEYHHGRIIPMTGGSTNHNQLAGNIYAALRTALKGQDFKLFIGDVRLWISAVHLYTYPDVMVIAGQPVFHADRNDTVVNPAVIIEVLSKSTQNYDRGGKFTAYRSIPEFCEYLLIDQYTIHVEHYVKTANKQWSFTEYDAEDERISLSTLPLEILFVDLYDQVEFETV
jgi:Uma2 family endonuclease